MNKYVILSVILILCNSQVEAKTFQQTKHQAEYIFSNDTSSFYCKCDYQRTRKGLYVNHNACAYHPKSESYRSYKIEWDHVMPVKRFAGNLQCWKEGGRKNCKNDPIFQEMENDLYNIVPSIGEINNRKSSKGFGLVKSNKQEYGGCYFKVDDVIEPNPQIRGDIARIFFYMSDRYGVTLTEEEIEIFKKWSWDDPVDMNEVTRGYKITAIQGNRNKMLD